MTTLIIVPSTVAIDAGSVEHFRVTEPAVAPESVQWSVEPGEGGADVGSIDANGTFSAPQSVGAPLDVTVVARHGEDEAKAVVTVRPVPPTGGGGGNQPQPPADSPAAPPPSAPPSAPPPATPPDDDVLVVPGELTLRAGEAQQFKALVKNVPDDDVEWLISPQVGTLSPSTGPSSVLYATPTSVREDIRIVVTAISKSNRKLGHGKVTLLADPWTGKGPNWIGLWLIVLVVLAPFLYLMWPPPGDRAPLLAAIAAHQEAQRVEQQRAAEVTSLRAALVDAEVKQAAEVTPPNPTLTAERQANVEGARAALAAGTNAHREAQRDVSLKSSVVSTEKEKAADNANDERNLFLLVLLAGALGSFVHTTRSFVDFMGNRRLRPSWTWWYFLQPFIGSTLAMVMYFVIRGGFFASATGATALNPWGFVAVAALVGLFSKQATNKLDELFSTMFRTDKERQLQDALQPKPDNGRAAGTR